MDKYIFYIVFIIYCRARSYPPRGGRHCNRVRTLRSPYGASGFGITWPAKEFASTRLTLAPIATIAHTG